MTDWTDIPNSSVDVDSPITEELMTALRDNPKALAERDSAAPHLNTTPNFEIIVASGNWIVPAGVTRAKCQFFSGGSGDALPYGGNTSVTRASDSSILCRATASTGSTVGTMTHGDLLVLYPPYAYGTGTRQAGAGVAYLDLVPGETLQVVVGAAGAGYFIYPGAVIFEY